VSNLLHLHRLTAFQPKLCNSLHLQLHVAESRRFLFLAIHCYTTKSLSRLTVVPAGIILAKQRLE
jgi:hypothetical protein